MNVRAQGGFVYFAQGHFKQAAELFYESRVDLREVRLPCLDLFACYHHPNALEAQVK